MGSFIAPLATGWLVPNFGWHWGFGIGGLGMLVALLVFRFYAVPLMRQYDGEVGLDSSWDRPTVARKMSVSGLAWRLWLSPLSLS